MTTVHQTYSQRELKPKNETKYIIFAHRIYDLVGHPHIGDVTYQPEDYTDVALVHKANDDFCYDIIAAWDKDDANNVYFYFGGWNDGIVDYHEDVAIPCDCATCMNL